MANLENYINKILAQKDQLTWLVCSGLVAWTCLVWLEAGPTLLAMELLIGQIKELTQY